ncbi:MAG: glycosyltransferase [Alphaproteobacteria bacterium]|nr:glycosyltransferase [Alphaproteobacteria bacterium]
MHACFPGHVRLYRFAGVPLRQVAWRPYPLPVAGDAAPVGEASTWLAGGNQRRDWRTLALAAQRLGSRARVDLYTRHAPPAALPPALAYRGTVGLDAFRAAVAGSRGVVLPVGFDPDVASGITVVAMALAAGRPVVGSRTPGLRDHVRDGVSGLLVDPGAPAALAEAVARVDADPALHAALAAGARAAGGVADVGRWADELLEGVHSGRVVGHTGGPWVPWPPAPGEVMGHDAGEGP